MIRFRQENKQAHRFAVGQTVQMRSFGAAQPAADKFKINALLPLKDGLPQYRIRGILEKHDRVAQEDSLVSATA